MRQLVAEVIRIVARFEIAPIRAPIGDGVHDAMHQLPDAVLAIGRAHFAVEIFADHDVGGRLGPVGRHLHLVLFNMMAPLSLAMAAVRNSQAISS